MFAEIDKKLRIGFSILYRIVTSIYILFVLYFNLGWNNIPWFKYFGIILIYIGLTFILKSKNNISHSGKTRRFEKTKATLRLTIDSAVVLIFLSDFNLNAFCNYFLIILPIINSINHSILDNKNIIVYVYTIVSIFYLDNFEIVETHIIPIGILWIIIQFFKFRFRISRYKDKLFQIIDEFYGVNTSKKEMSIILKSLANQINSSLKGIRFGDMRIENISCFKQKNKESLILISSGKLVESYKFDSPEMLIKNLDEDNREQNVQIWINGELQKYNVVFKAKGNFYSYIYVITFSQPVVLLNSIFALRLVVEPSFKHLSKLLEIKWIINTEKRKLYSDLRKKHEYVIKSMEVLHFVKGALSPFSTLNDAIKLYKTDIDNERKARTLERIYRLSERSTYNSEQISKRAEMIYDKSSNPFASSNIERHSFQEFFAWTRRNWEEKTDSSDIILIKELSIDSDKIFVEYDEEMLDAVFTELYVNINKYSGPNKRLEFRIEESLITINVCNECKNLTNKDAEHIKRIASKHNMETRPTINQRDSERFGMFIIKDYLEQMNIKSSIQLTTDKMFIYTLKLDIK